MGYGQAYAKVPLHLWAADVDYVADDVRMALLESTYVPNLQVDEFWSDVSAHECSGTGYTAEGKLLTTKSLSLVSGATQILADPVTWTTVTMTGIRWALIYQDTGTPSTSVLLMLIDLITDQSATAENLTVDIPPLGWITDSAY